jgi:hypothetical protein
VTGELHFGPWREDAHPGIESRISRRHHERRLCEIELTRDVLHAGGRNAVRLGQHSERVAGEGRTREHVGNIEAIAHLWISP